MLPWQFHTPDASLAPQVDLAALLLECGPGYHIGYFSAETPLSDGACSAALKVRINCDGGAHPYATAVWKNAAGEALQHDYFTPGTPYTLHMNLPEAAAGVEVQLGAYFTSAGTVRFTAPEMSFGAKILPRHAVFATAHISRTRGPNNLAEVLAALEQTAELPNKPDLLLFCENALFFRCGVGLADSAMALDHPLIDVVRRAARSAGTYVVLPIIERDGLMRYNTALLIDRSGSIVFKHRKTLLPYDELMQGIACGNSVDCYDTDFGRIAILICWEHYFPEPARIAQEKGAQVLFVPSLGVTDAQIRARAADNGIPIVFSGPDAGSGRIISPKGEVLVTTAGDQTNVVSYRMDLSRREYQVWLSFPTRAEPRSVYHASRRSDLV